MLHFKHYFYKVLAYIQSNIARNNSALNVELKGKAVTKPVPTPTTTLVPRGLHPLDSVKIAFPDTFNRDCKKLKSFLIQTKQ